MQQHEQTQFLRALGLFVTEQVKAATQPLLTIVDGLQRQISDMNEKMLKIDDIPKVINGVDGKDGQDGKDGKDADMQEVGTMIAQSRMTTYSYLDQKIADLPKPENGEKGDKGDKGDPGKDGKDGESGKDGKDGTSISLSDVEPVLHRIVDEAVAALPVPVSVVGAVIDRGGDLCIVLSSGETKSLGKVVGQDGKSGEDGAPGTPGKDGVDGIGFKDMSVTFDGERNFVFKFVLDERTEELSLTVPFMIYRGVWKEGSYSRGDCVTRDGSMFVARDDTDKQPGTIDSGWQLATKRGRDGKDLR